MIADRKNIYAGLMFMGFGAAALVLAREYAVGTAARMGPGYFPVWLGGVLLVLGAIIALIGWKGAIAPASRFTMRPLLVISAAIVLFGSLLTSVGLVLAAPALVLVSRLAEPRFGWREALVLSAVLTVFVIAIFCYGLKLPLPLWPRFG